MTINIGGVTKKRKISEIFRDTLVNQQPLILQSPPILAEPYALLVLPPFDLSRVYDFHIAPVIAFNLFAHYLIATRVRTLNNNRLSFLFFNCDNQKNASKITVLSINWRIILLLTGRNHLITYLTRS